MAKFANAPFREKVKDRQGIINLAKQVALDNFAHYTFIYFPVFYIFKEAIQVGASVACPQKPCRLTWMSPFQGKDHDGTPWGIISGGMNKVSVRFGLLLKINKFCRSQKKVCRSEQLTRSSLPRSIHRSVQNRICRGQSQGAVHAIRVNS